MNFDYSTLNGKIVEIFGTQYNFAIAMGLSERSLSLKLNDKVAWKDKDILKAVDLLGIDKKEIYKYFFKIKVQMFELERVEC
ncbi:DUF739 domain-containing protein [Staphylococcus xylosus]|uniref:DUF739 family protein n=1 Tax=Staphylococcus xylosus TaxID=1288 RepID=UPI000D1D4BAA|nr:DUF739 family protein [Staphylococcus xylosus]PTH92912.1 DUF739 domain-containing protein [Staphylococcus xylosus]